MPLKIDKRHGFGMIGIFVAILAVGLLMVSITRLLMSMSQGIGNLSERLEMQSIIQDQWKQMNAGTYEDFEDIVAAKGSPWTQSFGEKYEMKVEFGGKGKYVDAACDSSGSVAETDRQCRKVTITIVSKALPDVMENLRMTRVSEPDEKELLKRIEERIAENGNKFNTLYTKTQSDERYVQYGMGDFACPWDHKKIEGGVGCVACDAPANDMEYRSGNCQLSTCPAGQVANAEQNGCVARVCETGFKLNAAGTACETCSGITDAEYAAPVRKKYYGANCSIQTCPIGQTVNSQDTGCEDIVCPAGFELRGDDCKCPSNQILDEASDSCKSCPSGQAPNETQTACEAKVSISLRSGCSMYNRWDDGCWHPSNFKSYCLGSSYDSRDINWLGSGPIAYSSNICTYTRNGYILPDRCYQWHYYSFESPDGSPSYAYKAECTVSCVGKKCT